MCIQLNSCYPRQRKARNGYTAAPIGAVATHPDSSNCHASEQLCRDIARPAVAKEKRANQSCWASRAEVQDAVARRLPYLVMRPLEFMHGFVPRRLRPVRTRQGPHFGSECWPSDARSGSGHASRLPRFIAAKQPLKLRLPEAADRHCVQSTRSRRTALCR
jgi:hypothetical protein